MEPQRLKILKNRFIELNIKPKHADFILSRLITECNNYNTTYDRHHFTNVMFCKMMQLGDNKEFFDSIINFELKGREGLSIINIIKQPEYKIEPRKFQAILNEISERSNIKVDFEYVEFHCRNCGHNKAEYEEVQIRSIDEPKTSFYTCLKCKKVTKV